MPASSRPVIVCLSSADWGFLRYRKQQLMERLSCHADVVYVNPPRAMKSREWPFRARTRQLSPSLCYAGSARSIRRCRTANGRLSPPRGGA